jgi:site-specific recombinase XerD
VDEVTSVTELVKELMGHEDIKWTVVYTEITDAALNAAVLRLPRRR